MGAFSSKSLVNVTPINTGFLTGYYHIGICVSPDITSGPVELYTRVMNMFVHKSDPTAPLLKPGDVITTPPSDKPHHTYISEPKIYLDYSRGGVAAAEVWAIFSIVIRKESPLFATNFNGFFTSRNAAFGNDVNIEFNYKGAAAAAKPLVQGKDLLFVSIAVDATLLVDVNTRGVVSPADPPIEVLKHMLRAHYGNDARLSWLNETKHPLDEHELIDLTALDIVANWWIDSSTAKFLPHGDTSSPSAFWQTGYLDEAPSYGGNKLLLTETNQATLKFYQDRCNLNNFLQMLEGSTTTTTSSLVSTYFNPPFAKQPFVVPSSYSPTDAITYIDKLSLWIHDNYVNDWLKFHLKEFTTTLKFATPPPTEPSEIRSNLLKALDDAIEAHKKLKQLMIPILQKLAQKYTATKLPTSGVQHRCPALLKQFKAEYKTAAVDAYNSQFKSTVAIRITAAFNAIIKHWQKDLARYIQDIMTYRFDEYLKANPYLGGSGGGADPTEADIQAKFAAKLTIADITPANYPNLLKIIKSLPAAANPNLDMNTDFEDKVVLTPTDLLDASILVKPLDASTLDPDSHDTTAIDTVATQIKAQASNDLNLDAASMAAQFMIDNPPPKRLSEGEYKRELAQALFNGLDRIPTYAEYLNSNPKRVGKLPTPPAPSLDDKTIDTLVSAAFNKSSKSSAIKNTFKGETDNLYNKVLDAHKIRREKWNALYLKLWEEYFTKRFDPLIKEEYKNLLEELDKKASKIPKIQPIYDALKKAKTEADQQQIETLTAIKKKYTDLLTTFEADALSTPPQKFGSDFFSKQYATEVADIQNFHTASIAALEKFTNNKSIRGLIRGRDSDYYHH